MSNTFYHGRYALSNNQWDFIEHFWSKPKVGGRRALNPRTVFNAILWILGSSKNRNITRRKNPKNPCTRERKFSTFVGYFARRAIR